MPFIPTAVDESCPQNLRADRHEVLHSLNDGGSGSGVDVVQVVLRGQLFPGERVQEAGVQLGLGAGGGELLGAAGR